ncbi:MAG: amidohydrolase [Chloroflexota bacterium]
MTTADLVVIGRVATLAGEDGFGWIDAIGIAGNRVIVAGSLDDVEAVAGPRTRRIRLAPDEVAIPGLSDAHLHLAEGGLSAERLDLTTSASLEDGLARAAAASEQLPRDRWLEGHGWDSDRWGAWPTADALARVAPGRRAAIWAHDHHSLWVSRAALTEAGIDAATADPAGGVVRRDSDGTPTGVLHENAARLVTRHVPQPTVEDLERGIAALAQQLVALGVVAVHDPGGLSLQTGLGAGFEAYRRLADRGALRLRVHVAVREEQLAAARDAALRSGDAIGEPGGRAVFGWLKLFADGTLGSRTAALLEPIEPEVDRPTAPGTERGVFTTPPDALGELARRAADAGIATKIHAIGDAAVRAALDALEPTVGRAKLVPRVEHVQLVAAHDIPRFGRAGVAASVQPIHLRADAAAARRLWGTRAERFGYPWAALLRSGALLAFGTDAPVESIDPWPGLAMAITRRSPDWSRDVAPFGPRNAISLAEALRAACIAPAAMAAEHDRGRLVAGQRADVVVIPAAALDEPVAFDGPLGTVRPRLVLVDGEVAFEA